VERGGGVRMITTYRLDKLLSENNKELHDMMDEYQLLTDKEKLSGKGLLLFTNIQKKIGIMEILKRLKKL
jgi:hypothetical protein